MSGRNRPSAFDVSFPEEAGSSTGRDTSFARNSPLSRSVSVTSQNSHGSMNRLKRKNEGVDLKVVKPRQLPPAAFYISRADEVKETNELLLPGEDPEGVDADDKPIRILTDFAIYDPKHKNEMVSLTSLEQDDGVDRQFEGVGLVYPYFMNDEDEGQEDEEDYEPIFVKLSAIMRYTMDYTNEKEPMYIETMFGWYILREPSKEYFPFYKHFYAPHKIAQIALASSIKYPRRTFDDFITRLTSRVDPFGRTYDESDIWQAIPEIQEAILDSDEGDNVTRSALMRHVLRNAPAPASRSRRRSQTPRSRPMPRQMSRLGQNLDLAVLKPENQNPTNVTPLIASLAEGFVNEELVVVGPPTPRVPKAVLDARVKKARLTMWNFVEITMSSKRRVVDYKKQDKLRPGSNFLKAIEIGGDIYKVGDFVILRRGDWGNVKAPPVPKHLAEIPEQAALGDYFWFAKIIYIKLEQSRAHIQWLEHGKQIMLGELANPQELFLNDLCGDVDLKDIVGKVTVYERPQHEIAPDEYFYKFVHHKATSSFTTPDSDLMEKAKGFQPPDNCPNCLLQSQIDQEMTDQELYDHQGPKGLTYGGKKYHLNDFILYRSETGPAHIGYIQKINFPANSIRKATITMLKVGRVSAVPDTLLPKEVVRDERHVYLTNEKVTIELTELVRVVFVYSVSTFPQPGPKLSEWLDLSPYHFYVRYKFPSLNLTSWVVKQPVTWEDLPVCSECCSENIVFRRKILQFRKFMRGERNFLPTLDLFGGVGAFSRGLADGSKCLKITHAVEISPSAAKTFKKNSPETAVFNQCANVMLRYAIKSYQSHDTDIPKQIFDDKERVPAPPKPGDIKALVAGFPCQSHSRLNMYQKADDTKSNLILNTLSWQDFLRPKISYYENVPGFLGFRLNAHQINQYTVGGGIEMGGLKFTVRALLDMGYQVRYGLLQAGHYGTPQRRLRFFIIAALDGYPLPEFPQPSHDFPENKGLTIQLPTGEKISPIRAKPGTSPHPFVSIHDAISDLPRFHWKTPGSGRSTRDVENTGVPVIECSKHAPFCGFKGAVAYHHRPKTTYQLEARLKPTTDLQHYTKCLVPKKVQRVISIPLTAGADYRSLPSNLFEWQNINQLSAVGRMGYKPGQYGRLGKNDYFPTTVTNMDPTAKQSRVLNPYCKRMVTVRELARSQGFPDCFVFESIANNVVTMHRQIGNAVPWPVGRAMGRELGAALFKKWRQATENVIEIEDDDDGDGDGDGDVQLPYNSDTDVDSDMSD